MKTIKRRSWQEAGIYVLGCVAVYLIARIILAGSIAHASPYTYQPRVYYPVQVPVTSNLNPWAGLYGAGSVYYNPVNTPTVPVYVAPMTPCCNYNYSSGTNSAVWDWLDVMTLGSSPLLW